MRRRLHLVSVLAVLGCGTTRLSQAGGRVALLDSPPGRECAAVGEVAGSADPFFGGLKPAQELVQSAQNDARNEAARQGATHLRFTGTPSEWPSGTFGGGRGVTVTGVAYRCKSAADAPAASDEEGCTKDTDCKGDRICQARTCVDPPRPSARGGADDGRARGAPPIREARP